MVTTPERITMLADREQTFAMTYEEWQARVAESAHSEWVDGEAVVFRSPKEKHQAPIALVVRLLGVFVEMFDAGIVRTAPYAMRAVPDGPVREPDVLFITREHQDRVTENGSTGPADLVIEFISPERRLRDRTDMFDEYQAVGVPEYWLFDPRPGRERADFSQLDARGRYILVLPDATGRYRSAVLPGFWLDQEWLWQEPLPKTLHLLALIASVQIVMPEQPER